MSDQEPVGKRMIGRLREHAEPYRPNAWEHFERFRAEKERKRRFLYYWMAAAALVVIFGTAILTNQITERGKTRDTIAGKHRNGDNHTPRGRLNPLNNRESEGVAESAANQHQPGQSPRISPKSTALPVPGLDAVTGTPDHSLESPAQTTGNKHIAEDLNPGFLEPQSFTAPILHFSQLYIRAARQELQTPVRTARPIRFGIGFSQQSNQAAHTDLELNYGLGGALSIPLSERIAFVTGFFGGKQSLHVEKQAALSAAEGLAQLQDVRYQWVNLELPLQIQYQVKTFKRLGITAVGGIALQSSVGQVADYNYKTRRTIATYLESENGPVMVSTQTIEDLSSVSENDHQNQWAWGSPLYFGVGVNYKLQNTAIEVEPYIKYPIGAVTAEKLRFTSMGFQLRLTSAFKKRKR